MPPHPHIQSDHLVAGRCLGRHPAPRSLQDPLPGSQCYTRAICRAHLEIFQANLGRISHAKLGFWYAGGGSWRCQGRETVPSGTENHFSEFKQSSSCSEPFDMQNGCAAESILIPAQLLYPLTHTSLQDKVQTSYHGIYQLV